VGKEAVRSERCRVQIYVEGGRQQALEAVHKPLTRGREMCVPCLLPAAVELWLSMCLSPDLS